MLCGCDPSYVSLLPRCPAVRGATLTPSIVHSFTSTYSLAARDVSHRSSAGLPGDAEVDATCTFRSARNTAKWANDDGSAFDTCCQSLSFLLSHHVSLGLQPEWKPFRLPEQRETKRLKYKLANSHKSFKQTTLCALCISPPTVPLGNFTAFAARTKSTMALARRRKASASLKFPL